MPEKELDAGVFVPRFYYMMRTRGADGMPPYKTRQYITLCTPMSSVSLGRNLAMIVTALLASYAFWDAHCPRTTRRRIRQKDWYEQLPANLDEWRIPGNCLEDEERIWLQLDKVLRQWGITQWQHASGSALKAPCTAPQLSSGFGYTPLARTTPIRLGQFQYLNPLSRAARTQEGHDIIIRVIVIGQEGHEHLKILRKLTTGALSLYSENHTLPTFAELHFEDIILGVFHKAGGSVIEAHGAWARNSTGDIVDMLLQMLEDAFSDNFIVQWHPESLAAKKISTSRPRVYLIDFEVAIQFPEDCPAEQRVCVGLPLGGSFPSPEMYNRQCPPEVESGKPYDPFKLDVWQLASSLHKFKSKIPAIDDTLTAMTDGDPIRRLGAQQALDRLGQIVASMPLKSLLFEPEGAFKFKSGTN
ncbi:hypothetical protein C0995_001198 [Termitomyces sp. Mi166|nr:hypothetical protein C0995_001198 [Termitomyces sp. Mi166\